MTVAETSRPGEDRPAAHVDDEKIDDAVLALLHLNAFCARRACLEEPGLGPFCGLVATK